MNDLIVANTIHKALCEAQGVEEVRDIHSKLDKINKAAKELELSTAQLNDIIAAKWRAEWHLGKWLEEVCPHGGDRTNGSKFTLNELEISPTLSALCRKMYAIDIEDLETYIAEWPCDKELNRAYLLSLQSMSIDKHKEYCTCAACGRRHVKKNA